MQIGGGFRLKAPARLAIGVIRAYQLCVSPYLPSSCRFYPTCSEYAVLAIRKYGLMRGVWLAGRRIARCHPFSPGGYDPV